MVPWFYRLLRTPKVSFPSPKKIIPSKSRERGAPVRCAAPAQCYCAWRITGAVTAPAGALCCPPDRPGPLRGASGQRTSAVSRCVGATGRLQRGPRPKVSLFPERSVVDPSLLALSAARCCCCCSSGSGEVLLLPTAFTARIAEGIITGSSAGANEVNARGT
jgi:hypothetical protein